MKRKLTFGNFSRQIYWLMFLFLISCNGSANIVAAESTAKYLAATYISETKAAVPTGTMTSSPSPTITNSPTATKTNTPFPTNTDTPVPTLGASNIYLNIYFIASDADGPIGCGEKLVPLTTGIMPTGKAEEDVRVALEKLFEAKVQYQYGTYNPLYYSNLIITSSQFEEEYNEIVVRTTGNLNRGEKGCGWDQIRLMVKRTSLAASGGQSVEVRFNQHAFNDYVSGDR